MVQAAVALASLAYGIYAGETQSAVARKGRREAKDAQRKAEDAALSDAKLAEQEENRARQKTPDLNVLLGDQSLRPRPGKGSIDVDRLLLSRPGLLGV